MTQMLLLGLVLAVVVGAGIMSSRIGELAARLGELTASLAAEFDKEKHYHEDAERREKQFAEMMKETHGLGPADAVPMPRRPPAIVLVAETLVSIDRHLAFLVEATNKLAGISRG